MRMGRPARSSESCLPQAERPCKKSRKSRQKFSFFQVKISPAGHYTWWALKEKFRALRRQNDMQEGDQINENSFRKTKSFSVSLYPYIPAYLYFTKRTQNLWSLVSLLWSIYQTKPNGCMIMKKRNEPNPDAAEASSVAAVLPNEPNSTGNAGRTELACTERSRNVEGSLPKTKPFGMA
jgi:hypothetical protein